MDYTKRLEELEQTRTDFGRKIQAFEQDFGHSSYLNRAPTIEDPRKLENARILADRYALIELLPKGGLVAEVGVDRGQFSHKILASGKPSELYLIDIDLSRLDSENVNAGLKLPHLPERNSLSWSNRGQRLGFRLCLTGGCV